MRVCQRTHKGLVRANNQDSLLVADKLYGVADGMGGHRGGETASRIAVESVIAALKNKTPGESALRLAVEAANRRIYETAAENESLQGMGTTLTFLWEGEGKALIAHVGDSRAYRLREGKLEQLTLDHSMVAELLRNNVITPEMAKTHPYRNIITRAVGIDPVVEADVIQTEVKPGDRWLMCSDGLYNMVEDAKIHKTLMEMDDEKAADRLMEMALENGGTDNITIVICQSEVAEA
ncbi:MAG: Stp1/IreP family PP2C-type Ser/Thr phosphatase [Clostridiales bacterium]|nr:Stp1/IreP family PP2C-type Ser/Thr phosphatase [Clostridiales bacterium]